MEETEMTTQSSASRLLWLAIVVAALLALAGVGLLAYAVFSIAKLPTAPASAPPASAKPATAKPATKAVAQANPTAAIIPTITQAAAQPPSEAGPATAGAEVSPAAVGATAGPASPVPPAQATTAVPPTAPPTADLSLKILQPANVRSGPGLVYPVISGLQAGTSVPIEGRDASGQWYAVRTGALVGWVSGIVASYGGDVSALPVIAAPPTPLPTATPVPPTATPVPPTAPPAATKPPSSYSSRGIVGVSFGVANPNVSVNEQIWFGFTVTNSTNDTVEYSALAAHTDAGYTAWSWTMQRLKPGETLEWRDNIKFDKAGTYQLYLGICYAGSVEACKTAPWDRLSPNVTITVN
jgi:uncharacterized protein YraI